MNNHSDEKTNPSRRRFAKFIAAAAALPFVSTLASAQVRPSKEGAGRSETQRQSTREDVRNEHDTPPPVLLMNGSFIFEVATAGSFPPATNAGLDRRQYRIQLRKMGGGQPSRDIFLAHIKIVDGDGEMLFRFNNRRREAVVVTIVDDVGEVVTLSAEDRMLLSDLKRSKKIGQQAGDPPMNPDRMRLRYANDPSNDERKMVFVKVSILNEILFNLDTTRLRSRGVELKVMIWWEEVP